MNRKPEGVREGWTQSDCSRAPCTWQDGGIPQGGKRVWPAKGSHSPRAFIQRWYP
jgi:hypothetical protein